MDRLTSRRVRRNLGFLFVAVTFVPAWGVALAGQTVIRTQPQGQPPRDRPTPQPRVGTAVVRGRVVDGVTGNPVPRARVRVMIASPVQKPPMLTDAQGMFEFTELPSGSYSVMVEKSTYLPARVPDMVATTMRARMRQPLLREGQVVENVTIPLFHGGAIAGRVVDAHGDPVENAQVRVARVMRGGRPGPSGQTQTNDLGEYRVPRLQSGRYIVHVRPQASQGFQDPSAADVPLPQPIATYYPNSFALSQAQPIEVTRGQTQSGVDMTLVEGTPTLVRGTVVRADGQAVNMGSVNSRAIGPDSMGGFDFGGGTGIRPGGQFQLTLAPGDYTLEAQISTVQGPGRVGPQDQLTGMAKLSVGGGSVEAVTIVVGPGATATGRVTFEGETPPPPSPGQAGVPLFNPDGPGCRTGQATIAADWTFKVEGLAGTCGASPQVLFGRWTLKSVTFRGQNITDQLVTFETGQQYSDVHIVVTDKRTAMDLRVNGDDGQPTREYVAIAFPIDKTKWNPQSRRVRIYMPPVAPPTGAAASLSPMQGSAVAGPGTPIGGMTGPQERLVNLPIGEYYVIAVDDIGAEDWQEPAVLERLTSSAIRVVVTDEAPIEVPLRRFSLAELMR